MQKRYSLCILLVFLPMFALGQTHQKSEEIKQPQPESVQVEISDIKAIAKGIDAQWSPDGKKIAFENKGIWVVSSDGKGEARQLTSYDNEWCFAWSPDSREIVYISASYYYEGKDRVFWLKVVNVEAGKIRIIYGPYEPGLVKVRWLEDSNIGFFEETKNPLEPKWILLDRFGKIPKEITSQQKIVYDVGWDILWMINADGTEKKRLQWAEKPKIRFINPVWSKTANKIAVHIVDSASSYTAITDEGGTSWQVLIHEGEEYLQWSPDGNWLIYFIARQGPREGELGISELYLISTDGKHKFQLTSTPEEAEMNPEWSPDGTKILFESPTSENIFVAKLKIK